MKKNLLKVVFLTAVISYSLATGAKSFPALAPSDFNGPVHDKAAMPKVKTGANRTPLLPVDGTSVYRNSGGIVSKAGVFVNNKITRSSVAQAYFGKDDEVQAPNISYPGGAQTYTIGTTITSLSPVNIGGAVQATVYGQVTTLAGNGTAGYANGIGTAASFNLLYGVAVDVAGNMYAADWGNNRIRKITPSGVVTTFAGSGVAGNSNGTGAAASFSSPKGVAVDAAGNVYVADYDNNLIRKITTAGIVTTLAGSGTAGNTNGTGTAASFSNPTGVAVDAAGNVYVADQGNELIRKITPAGEVSTLAGSGSIGSINGTGTSASFYFPTGITVDAVGNVYVADMNNNLVRKITPAGAVSTLAGSGTQGSANGTGTAASFKLPPGVAVDATGNVYVADYGNHLVRKITPAGVVSTLAGNGTAGSENGIGTAARFYYPPGVAADAAGNIYVADGDDLIRKIAVAGYTINPALPAGLSFDATTGVISGTPTATSAAATYTIAASNAAGSNTTTINIAVNAVTLQAPKITYTGPQAYTVGADITTLMPANTGGAVPATVYGEVSTFAGSGAIGSADGISTAATFGHPYGVAVDSDGNVYIGDFGNNLIRKITSAGVVTTLAGSGLSDNNNGTGTAASFYGPWGVAVDAARNVYVADVSNNLIRKITQTGVVTTLAGSKIAGSTNGTGSAASFKNPTGVAVDAAGNVYVADSQNNLIRKITSAGVVTTLAGSGIQGSANGTGIAASFSEPQGVAVDATGNVYVADPDHHLIRKITSDGVVSTLAGSGAEGSTNGIGTAASFSYPYGLAVDVAGNIYVADNNLIRKITQAGVVSTLAGSGIEGSANGVGTSASFLSPHAVAVDEMGNLYVADSQNNLIRKIITTGYTISPALPAGLSFDATTGAISGTPTAASTGTYTITAWNAGGSSTATVNITVSAAAPPVQAPKITYAGGTQTYTAGTAITALSPQNSGGAVPATAYLQVSTLAGISGVTGSANGTGTAASFYEPRGVAADAAGNVYVADENNNLIRKITPSGVVTTLAGNGTAGSTNGTGTAASFDDPKGIAVDAAGNVYVGESGGYRIRKITAAGVVTTLAGSGTDGATNGTGTAASFSSPKGLAVDASGNVYVADEANYLIRKVTPAGVVTTFAGSGASGAANGTGTAASFSSPIGIAVDGSNNLYVTDGTLVRKITSAGVVSTLAGGAAGVRDGTGTAAGFDDLQGITIDKAGNLYVLDDSFIRKITPSGVVTTLAGKAATGAANGVGLSATFANPYGIAATLGNIYIGDTGNALVRKLINTGYSISPALPAGLVFSSSTGIITGTPAGASPATNYSITAINEGGSNVTTVNIAVKAAAPATPPPAITYSGSTQTYTAGTIIATLSPVNSGGAIPANFYGQVSTFAGSGAQGHTNGTGTAASFYYPAGIAVDAAGNVYVADENNNLIRKISAAGVVSTLAGNGTVGNTNGAGNAASFKYPTGLSVDAAGNVYVADQGNDLVRKITPGGIVSTLAGGGPGLHTNDTGTAASFHTPSGVAVDAAGNVYVADWNNDLIRKITPADVVSTFAGSGTSGNTNGNAMAASFSEPWGLTVDAAGNVYVAEMYNNLIRKITPAGIVSTLAGGGNTGNIDGTGTAARFSSPEGVAVDAAGNVYVADSDGNRIRKITPAGVVTTLAGDGNLGTTDGPGKAATFEHPQGVAIDANGNVYVADIFNNKIRKITTTGYIVTPALPAGLNLDNLGNITGTPTAVSPATIYTITAYNTGGSSTTTVNLAVKAAAPGVQAPKITYAGGAQTYTTGTAITALKPANSGGAVPANFYGQVSTFAGSGAYGNANGTGTAAIFSNPEGVAADAAGNVYVVDSDNNLIRKITPAGVVSTLAGSGGQGNANGTGTAASFNSPFGIAADAAGNVYVADTENNLVRKITTGGVVSTLAGSGAPGSSNGKGTAASFMGPTGITVDAAGNVYVAEEGNYLIRKITPAGLVSTLAGSGVRGNANGTGAAASFGDPLGMAADLSGNIYVADAGNNLIRKITPAGVVSTLAGSGAEGNTNDIGTAASFNDPEGVAVDAAGNVYVVEEGNGLIRKITAAGMVSTVAGTGALGKANGDALVASFHNPTGLTIDAAGNVYIADKDNNMVRKLTTSGYRITPALPAGLKFDEQGNITGTPTVTSPASTYTVTAYNAGGSSTTTVNITVKAVAQLTFAAIPAKTYGAADFNPGAISTAGTPISYTSSNTAVATIIAGKVHILATGTTIISASDGTKTLTQLLTVNPAPLTITADNKSRIYGAANPVLTLSYSGFVNGDTHDNLKVQPSAVTTATLASGVNTYPITASGAVSDNYSITYVPGVLNISTAPAPHITFSALTPVTYGAADIIPVAASVNTVTPVTFTSSNASVAIITAEGTIRITGAGSTTITASQGANANYEAAAPATQGLKVSPAMLKVAADNQARVYGAANPGLTIKYTGFVNGDTQADLITPSTVSTTATAASPVGAYPITPGGGTSPNYTFTYTAGTLTITPATLTVTADNKSKYYSDVNPPLTISYKGFVNGDSQASLLTPANAATTATTLSAAGSYPITVTGATAANYSVAFVSGTFTVKPAPAPAITAISNNKGVSGTTVEITGTYLLNTTAVKFGGAPASSFIVNSATSITATVGAGASGDIAVTTTSGTGRISGFTYVLSLPANNFKLSITSAICNGSNNGSVNITAAQALSYTATITGNGINKSYNFTASTDISDLAAGSYSVCITVAGQSDYRQCFDVVITEPKDLSLFSTVNTTDKTVRLTLNGGDSYNIKLNDKLYTTTANTIELPLNEGNNTLEVTTDRLCQGLIQKIINISGIIIPYPDPFDDVLNVNLGTASFDNLTVEVHRVSDGKLVFSQQYVDQSGTLKLNLSNLKKGIYALKLASANMQKIFKVIKK